MHTRYTTGLSVAVTTSERCDHRYAEKQRPRLRWKSSNKSPYSLFLFFNRLSVVPIVLYCSNGMT